MDLLDSIDFEIKVTSLITSHANITYFPELEHLLVSLVLILSLYIIFRKILDLTSKIVSGDNLLIWILFADLKKPKGLLL